MASSSTDGQDECSLLVVKKLCFGVNILGSFGLVCLGGVFREDGFPIVGVDFLKMRRTLLDEGVLMADHPDENFDKYLLVLGRGFLRGS